MTLVLLSFLLLQLFQCSLRFLRGLSLVANPERKVLQSYGEFSYRANFLRLFFRLTRFSAIFLRFIPKNASRFQSLRRRPFQNFPGSRRSPSGVRFSKASAKVDIPHIPSKYFRSYFAPK